LTRQQCQIEFNKKWKTIKECKNRSEEAEKYLKELKGALTLKRHSPGSLVNLFAKVAAKSSTAQSSDAASSEESENVKKKGFVHVSKKFLLFYCSFSILAWPSSVVSNFRKWFEGHREI
jgi:hypothetical protein